MKKLIALSILIASFGSAMAQQDAMFSQYVFNGLLLNPAYAGSHKYFSSTLHYRTQWVGYKGAPETGILAMDLPFSNEKMGLGLIVSNDHIGVTTQNDVFLNYAYHLKLGDSKKLAFGVKGGISHYTARLRDLEVWDEDEVFMDNVESKWMPKFGTGAYFYDENFYAGISVPTLLAYESGKDFDIDIEESSRVRKHFFLTGGYVHKFSDNVRVRPSTLIKYVDNAPLEADFNLAFLLNEMVWVGVTYRTGDAVAGIIEYQANKYFRVGYAYDMTTSRLRHYNVGTHEIVIGIDLGRDLETYKPRLF